MLAGTGSDVGKSVLATALCRIFLQDGYHPAPFKAQNMALNSYATPDGLEIGRAQAVQAEAAGLPCHTDMNPLLLKPQSDHTSQVVLHGKPIGNRDAYSFFSEERRVKSEEFAAAVSAEGIAAANSSLFTLHSSLRKEVCAAFDRLAAQYNPIVMEGAGSICELNLRSHDLVNMPMAQHAKADVLLVGDIDRGGIFASVYGSIMLQTPEDRRRIKGIIVNKFRGDMRLFDDGRRMLQDICGVPVLGVIPYLKDVHIEGEDSVALEKALKDGQSPLASHSSSTLQVSVVRLPHISNYTDFDALSLDTRVHLIYSEEADELLQADIIILPGTKSTLSDLQWLRRKGLDEAILQAHRDGKTVVGVCGGYQMMGVEVLDPNHVEGSLSRLPGLGLLPVTTTMSGEKTTRQTTFTLQSPLSTLHSPLSTGNRAYEIHMGRTTPFGDAPLRPFALLDDGRQDGYVVSPTCMGTYLHGAFDNQAVVDMLLQPFAHRIGQRTKALDYQAFKEEQYDRLASHVRQYLDMEKLYQILTSND